MAPSGGLFVKEITNPNGNCTGIIGRPLPCDSLRFSATVLSPTSWNASLLIPLSILDKDFLNSSRLLVNLFRIEGKGDTRKYSCWKSTASKPACFHRPEFFQNLTFEAVA